MRVERRAHNREDEVPQPAEDHVVVDAGHPPQRVLQPRVQPPGLRGTHPCRVHPGVEQCDEIVRIGRVGGQDAVGVAGSQRRSSQAQVTEQSPQQPHLPGGEPGGQHE